MDKEYFKQLKEVAPKLMQIFCDTYGYTEYQGEYYNNYLIRATKPKVDYIHIHIGHRIDELQNNYDANLENFKLNVMAVIGHLEANNYKFNCILSDQNKYTVWVNKIAVETDSQSLEYALQDASIIAAKDLEDKLIKELNK